MKNSVFIFNNELVSSQGMLDADRTGSLGIPIYDGIKLKRIKEVLQNLDRDRYFGILHLSNNICLDKISYQIYKSPDYWDILLLVNDIDPLFGMPYDYDIVSESTTAALETYEKKIYRRKLPDKDRVRLQAAIAGIDAEKNEVHRKIYYVYPERIYEVRQILYEQGALNVS